MISVTYIIDMFEYITLLEHCVKEDELFILDVNIKYCLN
jgi:hypothetical protein